MRKTSIHVLLSGVLLGLPCLSPSLAVAKTDATVQTTTVRWGPMTIPARDADGPGDLEQIAGLHGMAKLIASLFVSVADYDVNRPCEDCYITSIAPNLVYADGRTANFANGVMLHHVNNLNIGEEDIACDPGLDGAAPLLGFLTGGNEVFAGAGNERTVGVLPAGYGYEVDIDDEWVLSYHLMNMTAEPKTVYFEYTFTWARSGVKKALPLQLGQGMCSDYTYPTPQGYSDAQQDWQSDRSGYILGASGHAHDHAISVALENVTRGETVFASQAVYEHGSAFAPMGESPIVDGSHPAYCEFTDSDPLGIDGYVGHIADMTVGYMRARLVKGDLLRLHTQYHRPNAATSDMGVMLTFMVPDFCFTPSWCL